MGIPPLGIVDHSGPNLYKPPDASGGALNQGRSRPGMRHPESCAADCRQDIRITLCASRLELVTIKPTRGKLQGIEIAGEKTILRMQRVRRFKSRRAGLEKINIQLPPPFFCYEGGYNNSCCLQILVDWRECRTSDDPGYLKPSTFPHDDKGHFCL